MSSVYITEAGRKRVFDYMKEDIFPFPEAFDEFKFVFGDDYNASDKSIIDLRTYIKYQKEAIEAVSLKNNFVKKYLLTHLLSEEYTSTKNELRLAKVLDQTFDFFEFILFRGLHYLQNDLHSKELQLEKRRQKRKRYIANKKNARTDHC